MYAKCLKETNRSAEYIRVLLRLLSKYASSERDRVRRRCIGEKATGGDSVRGYFQEARELSNSLETEIRSELDALWMDVGVDPYPRQRDKRDGFEVVVKLRSLLPEEVEIDYCTVTLTSTATGTTQSASGREITLKTNEAVKLAPAGNGIGEFSVFTTTTVPGTYALQNITLCSGKLVFSHDYETPSSSNPGHASAMSALTATTTRSLTPATTLTFFPSPTSLVARLEMPARIHLAELRTVEIVIATGGNNQLITGEIRIKSGTAGLRLMTGSLSILSAPDGAVLLNADTPGKIPLGPCPRDSEIRLSLPYTSETEVAEITVKLEIEYTSSDESTQHLYAAAVSVPVALPLAVNVQDIFKRSALFSKFQVCTSYDGVPLRISSASLPSNKSYKVRASSPPIAETTVFAKQPASFIYRITPRPNPTPGAPQPLELLITYTNLSELHRHILTTTFLSALSATGLEQLTHFLLPHLPQPQNLDTAAILNFIPPTLPIPRPPLVAIAPELRQPVQDFLESFFTTSKPLVLEDPAAVERRIIIPVEVPRVTRVVEVGFSLQREQLEVVDDIVPNLSTPITPVVKRGEDLWARAVERMAKAKIEGRRGEGMYSVGSSVSVELIVNWEAGVWGGKGGKRRASYEIRSDPEVWLVSGRKRRTFEMNFGEGGTDGKEIKEHIVLVPVKPGCLRLPAVVVVVEKGGEEGGDGEEGQGGEVEVEMRSEAVTVDVGLDVRSVTVRMGDGGGGEEGRR